MLKIAICDDCEADRITMDRALRAYVATEGIACFIACFDASSQVLSSQGFDMYLLDIMMPGMDGMELAKKLREKYPQCGIVFITASPEFAIHGYSVNAVGYLLKPLADRQLQDTFDRMFSLYAPCTLALQVDGIPVDVPVATILFMESQLRNTLVYLKNGDTVFLRQKLEDIWSEAQTHQAFVRCHKSFVVNLDFVMQMQNQAFKLVNNIEVPISRSARAESKAAYYKRKVRTETEHDA